MIIKEIKLIDYGICVPVGEPDRYVIETGPQGYSDSFDEVKMLETTTWIPMRKGISFGIFYDFVLEPEVEDEEWEYECYTYHPGITNPETGKQFTYTLDIKEDWVDDDGEEEDYCEFMTLEHNWEMVPGEWVFKIVFEHQVILEKKFFLYEEDDIYPSPYEAENGKPISKSPAESVASSQTIQRIMAGLLAKHN